MTTKTNSKVIPLVLGAIALANVATAETSKVNVDADIKANYLMGQDNDSTKHRTITSGINLEGLVNVDYKKFRANVDINADKVSGKMFFNHSDLAIIDALNAKGIASFLYKAHDGKLCRVFIGPSALFESRSAIVNVPTFGVTVNNSESYNGIGGGLIVENDKYSFIADYIANIAGSNSSTVSSGQSSNLASTNGSELDWKVIIKDMKGKNMLYDLFLEGNHNKIGDNKKNTYKLGFSAGKDNRLNFGIEYTDLKNQNFDQFSTRAYVGYQKIIGRSGKEKK